MATAPVYSLTSGSIQTTFEEAVASVFNYGYRQTVFEVERLSGRKGKGVVERTFVLRPSSTPIRYPHLKPGDEVLCPGLGESASAHAGRYRIRRMAEGFGPRTMTEYV